MGEEQGEANWDWKQRDVMAEDMSSWFCQLSTQERLQVGQCCAAIRRGWGPWLLLRERSRATFNPCPLDTLHRTGVLRRR